MCQRDFILNGVHACPNERYTGYTTAYCIKLLLTEGEPIRARDYGEMERLADGWHGRHYTDYFRRFLYDHYEMLKEKGVKVRQVELKKPKDVHRPQAHYFN